MHNIELKQKYKISIRFYHIYQLPISHTIGNWIKEIRSLETCIP